jgi:hypothetical protein
VGGLRAERGVRGAWEGDAKDTDGGGCVCVWEQGAQPGHVHAAPVVSGALAALAEEAACTCGSCKYLTRYLPRLGRTFSGAGGVHGQSICVYFF